MNLFTHLNDSLAFFSPLSVRTCTGDVKETYTQICHLIYTGGFFLPPQKESSSLANNRITLELWSEGALHEFWTIGKMFQKPYLVIIDWVWYRYKRAQFSVTALCPHRNAESKSALTDMRFAEDNLVDLQTSIRAFHSEYRQARIIQHFNFKIFGLNHLTFSTCCCETSVMYTSNNNKPFLCVMKREGLRLKRILSPKF